MSDSLDLQAPRALPPGQPYGDLTVLNTERLILDSVGKDILSDIVMDYLQILETSAAVYEQNGDYALGIFTSGWCRQMDAASRARCHTDDNPAALSCGNWHCHESCWSTSRQSIETGRPADLACLGGIRIYAVPIVAHGRTVGSINFGYGSPPTERRALEGLADQYGLDADRLAELAAAYPARAPELIEITKRRLGTAARLIGAIIERRQAEDELRRMNEELDARVKRRTSELQSAIEELEGFSYSVAHDLRAPLRAVDGFAKIVAEEHAAEISSDTQHYLERIRTNIQQMGKLIDDLLCYARLGRESVQKQSVAPTVLARQAITELREQHAGRRIDVRLDDMPRCFADPVLLKQVFVNLLDNAFKYTRARPAATVEVGSGPQHGEQVYFVRDNGVGFDMQYADKLFGVFHRLHRAEEYEGTGVGLAIVKRIVTRHGGRVWCEAEEHKGATFYFVI